MATIRGNQADVHRKELQLSRKIHTFKNMLREYLKNCPRDRKKEKYNIINLVSNFEYDVNRLNSANYYGFLEIMRQTLTNTRARLDMIDMELYDLKTEYEVITAKQFKKLLNNFVDIRNLYEGYSKYLQERIRNARKEKGDKQKENNSN